MRANSRGETRRESTPSTVALPRVGSMMFIGILMLFALPAPFAPISAKALPSGTERLRLASVMPAQNSPGSPLSAPISGNQNNAKFTGNSKSLAFTLTVGSFMPTAL